jgi:hypothetical protein
MTARVRCNACGTAFVVAADRLGLAVACPKCGVDQPASPADPATPAPAGSTWKPATEPPTDDSPAPRKKRRRLLALLALAASCLLGVAAILAWPSLARWWRPALRTPALVAATAYLEALVAGDPQKIRALGTVEEPPAIRSFAPPTQVPDRRTRLRGSFAPIGRLNAQIDKRFEYDPEIGRFKVRNALGPAAETLDLLEEAKAKGDDQKIAKKIESGNPEDIFDAAEALASVWTKLADGVLSSKKLVPTYPQLVKDAKPKLPPDAESLALDYANDAATWDALLKRPFPTLKADGPYILDRSEVNVQVRDKLASLGDPPSTLRLTLTRFQLEGIDTGWKVTSARRVDPAVSEEPAKPSREASPPPPRSPGDRPF